MPGQLRLRVTDDNNNNSNNSNNNNDNVNNNNNNDNNNATTNKTKTTTKTMGIGNLTSIGENESDDAHDEFYEQQQLQYNTISKYYISCSSISFYKSGCYCCKRFY